MSNESLLSADEQRELLSVVGRFREERDEAIQEATILQDQIDNHYIPRVVSAECAYDKETGRLGNLLGEAREQVETMAALADPPVAAPHSVQLRPSRSGRDFDAANVRETLKDLYGPDAPPLDGSFGAWLFNTISTLTARAKQPMATVPGQVFSIPPEAWEAIGAEVDRLRGAGLISKHPGDCGGGDPIRSGTGGIDDHL